jgi:hypothetical protein
LNLGKDKPTNRILGGCLDLKSGGSFFDIYAFVDNNKNLPIDPCSKVAILLPILIEASEFVILYGTIARNRMVDVRVFRDRQDTTNRLTAPEPD